MVSLEQVCTVSSGTPTVAPTGGSRRVSAAGRPTERQSSLLRRGGRVSAARPTTDRCLRQTPPRGPAPRATPLSPFTLQCTSPCWAPLRARCAARTGPAAVCAAAVAPSPRGPPRLTLLYTASPALRLPQWRPLDPAAASQIGCRPAQSALQAL